MTHKRQAKYLNHRGSLCFLNLQTKDKKALTLLSIFVILLICIVILLKNIADTLVVTSIGAESLSFIKIFFVSPTLIMSVIIYKSAQAKRRKELNFYYFMIANLFLTLLFTFLVVPNQDRLHPAPETIENLILSYPALIIVLKSFGHWTNVIFYSLTMASVNALYALVFWQISNDIVVDKKSVFPILGLVSGFGLLFSGAILNFLTLSTGSWIEFLRASGAITAAILLTIVIVYNKIGLDLKRQSIFNLKKYRMTSADRKKSDTGLVQDVGFVLRKKSLLGSFSCAICLGFLYMFIEYAWKTEAKEVYPAPEQYAAFISQYTIFDGFVSLALSLVAIFIIPRMKWLRAALSGQFFLLFFVLLFIGVYIAKNLNLFALAGSWLYSDLLLVWLGAAAFSFSTQTQYNILTPLLKMCYAKMSKEMETRGRAIIDMLGKSASNLIGAALIQVGVILFPEPQTAILVFIPIYILFTVIRIGGLWLINRALPMDDA